MKIQKASEMKKSDRFKAMIYAEPGAGENDNA